MRTAVATLAFAAVAATAGGAGATPAPLPGPCRAAAVDPVGDTYGGNADEPHADLTTIGFARAWMTLQVEVRVADVDAAPNAAVLGREVRAAFTAGQTRFVARWRETGAGTVAELGRAAFASAHGPAGEPGSWDPVRWGEIGWSVDAARDAVTFHVPIEALEAHGVVVGPGTTVRDAAATTYAVAQARAAHDQVAVEHSAYVPIDDMAPGANEPFRLGDPSCR